MSKNNYNTENVFAKIIRGEIPCKKIFEDEMVLAFHDIAPAAPVHILVIPKGEYVNFADFIANASPEFITHYFKKIEEIAKSLNLQDYRIISNLGEESGQTVFHFHTHIISGKKLLGLIG
jgi:histidine triad (HIT) family protein